MIVWLASYPRSGNTLLRTVLKRCLGLDSYADEPIHVESPLRSDNSLIGHVELPSDFEAFYAKASRAPEMSLVKTHLPPRDEMRFIYVVRDGRSAVRSYEKYYAHYVPGHKVNLFRLIAGDDAYGDWTAHYRAWNERPRAAGLVVRFEELTQVSMETLQRIAAFLRHRGPIKPWTNPFDELARHEPGFFRQGGTQFTQGPDWPPLVDEFFHFFHGPLMSQLGYASPAPAELPSERRALFEWAREVVARNRDLMGVCNERLELIERLHQEAQKRLDVINALHAQDRAS